MVKDLERTPQAFWGKCRSICGYHDRIRLSGWKSIFTVKESAVEEVLEELAVCEDDMMEEYLEEGRISLDKVQKAVADRQVFPCYFGFGTTFSRRGRTFGWT